MKQPPDNLSREQLDKVRRRANFSLFYFYKSFIQYSICVSAQWENSEAVPENESRRGNLQRFEIRDDDETERMFLLYNNNNNHNNHDNNNDKENDKTNKEVST